MHDNLQSFHQMSKSVMAGLCLVVVVVKSRWNSNTILWMDEIKDNLKVVDSNDCVEFGKRRKDVRVVGWTASLVRDATFCLSHEVHIKKIMYLSSRV
jgi:hypothetical protein